LSSEGIYNHWWDFSKESKTILKTLNQLFEINIWVWFREPVAFAESFYKQCMRNPVVERVPCYGKDLSFSEILKEIWFIQHLDYLDFVEECEELFGENSITVFEYQQDTVQTVSHLLGLNTPHDNPTPRKNNSINAMTTELYRVLNRLELAAKDKEKLVPYLQKLDTATSPYLNRTDTSIIDKESERLIKELTAEMMIDIKKRYFKV